jgi:hypothetical protein
LIAGKNVAFDQAKSLYDFANTQINPAFQQPFPADDKASPNKKPVGFLSVTLNYDGKSKKILGAQYNVVANAPRCQFVEPPTS